MKRALISCMLTLVFAQLPLAAAQDGSNELAVKFQAFLGEYQPQMKARNADYLKSVHPKLPAEAYDFFFDVTLNMMKYAEETEGAEPKIECQEFNVCRVIYPQPNDSWAAQRFILHEGNWRWLDQ